MITILTAVEKIHSTLKPIQKHLMMVLANFSNQDGEVIISSKRMIKSLGCARSTFFAQIKNLEALGWVKRESRYSGIGSCLSSLYRLNLALIDEVCKSSLLEKISRGAMKKLASAFKSFLPSSILSKIKQKLSTVQKSDPPRPIDGPHNYIRDNTSTNINNTKTRVCKKLSTPKEIPDFAKVAFEKLMQKCASNKQNQHNREKSHAYTTKGEPTTGL